MKKNVGGRDRAARLVVGLLLVVAGVAGYAGVFRVATGVPQALTSLVLVVLGLVVLLTAVTRRCMVNRLLGRDTS